MKPPTLLLLLSAGLASGFVPPPENVKVKCQNLRVVVSWDYNSQQPDTTFRVQVKGITGNEEYDTKEHQYNLTDFIWTSEERYMDNFGVRVVAALGGNQSVPVETATFSFNQMKAVDLFCKLDFPPAVLTRLNSRVIFSFPNPAHFYELKNKSNGTVFQISANSSAKERRFSCSEEEEICRHDWEFSDGVEECITLNGVLFSGNEVGQVFFKQTGHICVSPSMEVHITTLVISLVVTIVAISGIAAAVCMGRAYTRENPVILPKSLLIKPRQGDINDHEPESVISVARLVARLRRTSSVSSEGSFQDDSDRRFVEGANQQLEAARYMEWDSTDESEKTKCVSIEDDEETEKDNSGYDCPHILLVDMGEGDMAFGYKE